MAGKNSGWSWTPSIWPFSKKSNHRSDADRVAVGMGICGFPMGIPIWDGNGNDFKPMGIPTCGFCGVLWVFCGFSCGFSVSWGMPNFRDGTEPSGT